MDIYNISAGNFNKLVPIFFDKGKYTIHYKNV